jgi:hypothetical protein
MTAKPYNPHILTKAERQKGGQSLQKLLKNKAINKKRIQGINKAYKNPEYKEKLGEAQKSRFQSKKAREEMSKKLKAYWTKSRREQESKNKLKFYKTHYNIKGLIDRKVTLWWKEHPNIRKQKSKQVRNFFIKHPEEFKKKFMNGKNNPNNPHIQTKLGKVRSKGEAEIANFLKENKIEAEYESKTLVLDGWVCVPDFYLPKQKVYIEFYGGYPGSRNKKIIKNKLYKKHKLKVIAITPSELYDLDREILGYLTKL